MSLQLFISEFTDWMSLYGYADNVMTKEQQFEEFREKLNVGATLKLHHCKSIIDVLAFQASMEEAIARNRDSKADARSRAKDAKILQQLTAKVAEMEKSSKSHRPNGRKKLVE